ncbi:hypothetical protein YH65_05715 [Sulfurovum lithotrophicum]|uniref:Uncharacterized protein n=1 Tax=Sulfurovum lithotrophicum TaxID=206403 RepID=A0A7U4RQN8_9BACT|nr:hypothetical protein [Sulfurovum lithotrophicum]AKF24941.1 hypothetical protein YH65_05715 [Sulfurovum lithotrophicum]
MKENKALTADEQLIAYEKYKAELLTDYHDLKLELAYAADSVEEGLIKKKRERLSRHIKTLSSKIDQLRAEENQT